MQTTLDPTLDPTDPIVRLLLGTLGKSMPADASATTATRQPPRRRPAPPSPSDRTLTPIGDIVASATPHASIGPENPQARALGEALNRQRERAEGGLGLTESAIQLLAMGPGEQIGPMARRMVGGGLKPDMNAPVPGFKGIPLPGDQFTVLTPENPGGMPLDAAANAQLRQQLEADLRAAGVPFRPVTGRYPDEHSGQQLTENSYLVHDPNDQHALSLEDAVKLGLKYGQNSILTNAGLHDLKVGQTYPATDMRGVPGRSLAETPAFSTLDNGQRFAMELWFDHPSPLALPHPEQPPSAEPSAPARPQPGASSADWKSSAKGRMDEASRALAALLAAPEEPAAAPGSPAATSGARAGRLQSIPEQYLPGVRSAQRARNRETRSTLPARKAAAQGTDPLDPEAAKADTLHGVDARALLSAVMASGLGRPDQSASMHAREMDMGLDAADEASALPLAQPYKPASAALLGMIGRALARDKAGRDATLTTATSKRDDEAPGGGLPTGAALDTVPTQLAHALTRALGGTAPSASPSRVDLTQMPAVQPVQYLTRSQPTGDDRRAHSPILPALQRPTTGLTYGATSELESPPHERGVHESLRAHIAGHGAPVYEEAMTHSYADSALTAILHALGVKGKKTGP